jgi:hypothetical protein
MGAPFVFIASFPRTGSTALAEALIDPPASFIHSEPGLCAGRLHPENLQAFDHPSVRAACDEIARIRAEVPDPNDYVALYVERVLPLFDFAQVGIKEVTFRRYLHRKLVATLPDLRVIVTVRDPRDIWLSLREMNERLDATWSWRDVTVDEGAHRFNAIDKQLAELVEGGALVVRYEELCAGEEAFARVREYVDSPLERAGRFGTIVQRLREWEIERHGQSFSAASVGRCERADAGERASADEFASLVTAYTKRFGY